MRYITRIQKGEIRMKVLEINSVNFGSTGNIMQDLAKTARENGLDVCVSYPQSRGNSRRYKKGDITIGNCFSRNLHLKTAMLTGLNGCFSWISTKQYLSKLENSMPGLIHLHNLHNCYINLPLLFRYIKHRNIPVIWTLHDCWSFTGHCPHFTVEKCDKWKTGCHHCPSYRQYPVSFLDNSKMMYKLKKKWFTGVPNMTIVTPSQWLADLVKESYLKDYPVKVIHNGIDLDVFKPTPNNFRQKYGIDDGKYIVLGVAFGWGKRKGLDVFVNLAKHLDSEKYQIVLVGTDVDVEKQLPENILSIHRTQNQSELAEIYTAADLFVNPTREDNYPTVNMEALACGTPVLTFATGGSPESIDETCGTVVPCDDEEVLQREIIRICEEHPYLQDACVKRAESFDHQKKYQDYIELYRQI